MRTFIALFAFSFLIAGFSNCSPSKNSDEQQSAAGPTPTPTGSPAPEPTACVKIWEQHSGNPVMTYGQSIPNIAFNDPSVIKEGSTYHMWMSGGDPTTAGGDGFPTAVRIYKATSSDGINWTINTTPLISPGAPGSWDDRSTETPNVAFIGGMYHLYYSGCNTGNCQQGKYKIGHATSPDGLTWTKDAANPILSYTNDPNHWGFYSLAEPGVVFDSATGKGHLYYTTMKVRPGGTGDHAAMQGVMMATSTDGTNFTTYDGDGDGFGDAVITQSASHPVSGGYNGYSTPFALIDSDHIFHVFYDVVRYPHPGDWRQVAIAHSTSPDGIHFTEAEANIFTIENTAWATWETLGEAVIQDGPVLKMWFAGHKLRTVNGTDYADWTTHGIGYATYGANCYP